MVLNIIVSKVEKSIPDLKDVYEALRPLQVTCQISGLAPYLLTQAKDGLKTYRHSLWSIIRCVVVFVLFTGAFSYLMTTQDSIFVGTIHQRLPQLQCYFKALIALVSLVFAVIYSPKILEVFQGVNDIDAEFHELAVWMPYRRNYAVVVLNLAGLSILAVTVLVWVFVDAPPQTMSMPAILKLAIMLPFLLLIYLMESQYINYLNLLRHRYSILNEYLEALALENKSHNGWVADEKDEDECTISKSIFKSIEIISNPIMVIEKVASLHIKLSDAALLINAAFAVQLLVRITVAFISIVMALYIIGVNFSSSSSADSTSTNVNIMFTAWAGSSALELLWVVWITNATCEEIVAGVTTYLVILIQFYSAGNSNKAVADGKNGTANTTAVEAVN